jgi:hypothetical protein
VIAQQEVEMASFREFKDYESIEIDEVLTAN